MSLTNLDFLDREAALYRHSKQQAEQSSNTIMTTVENNTKQEVDAVNQAIKNLNQKVEQILNTEQMKLEQNKIESSQKQMNSSIKTATETFFKVKKIIRDKKMSPEQTLEYEKKLYKKIIEKFLTQEEIAEFEKIIKMGPMFIMGGRPQIQNSNIRMLN